MDERAKEKMLKEYEALEKQNEVRATHEYQDKERKRRQEMKQTQKVVESKAKGYQSK